MPISVSQYEAKSRYFEIIKSCDLAQFFEIFAQFFACELHFKYFEPMYNNMGPKTIPSLIFPGVGQN